MLEEFERGGLGFTPDDTYVFSSWSGYLDDADPKSGWNRAKAVGAHVTLAHTSGHASPIEIERFARSLAPKAVVPVHGLAWDNPGIETPPIQRLVDGQAWLIA